MNVRILIFLIVSVLFNQSKLYAQTSTGGFPLEESSNHLKSAVHIPVITMPKADFKADSGRGPLCGNKFAHKFEVNTNLKKEGVHTISGNYNVWRLGFKSANAYSLNLILNNFVVPTGARLFLYSPNKEQIKGAYTMANNTRHNFAISPIDGEEIIVDYEEPINSEFKADIIIKSVNHDFLGLKTLPHFSKSASCQVDAAKDTVHLNRQSSCELIIDGGIYCSGNLINNTNQDANPYIVTSNHCFWTTEIKRINGDYQEIYLLDTTLAHTTIAFFNYESPSEAWDIEGTKEMSLSGAKAIATRKTRDMMLLQLDEIPPVDYRPYYAGWNRTVFISGPIYTFHHPQGDVKKISVDEATPVTRSYETADDLFLPNSHWRIYRWDEGMTEGGSSGAALFDSNDHIIGCLTGGNTSANCNQPGEDYFWQIGKVWSDSSYKKNIGYWLDPKGSNVYTLDGLQPYKSPCKRITHRAHNDIPAEKIKESDNKSYLVGSNAKGITEFAEKFTLNNEVTLYGVYFFPVVGTYSTQNPIYLRIYKGTDQPDSLVYEQKVRIQTKQYNHNEDLTINEDTHYWGGMENYLRLTTPLKLDSTFFVSFTAPSIGSSTPFALYHSEAKENNEKNTAYFLNASKKWQPFTQHPSIEAPTSLMVDVVLQEGWDIEDPLIPETPDIPIDPETPIVQEYPKEIQFYPALTSGELNIGIPKGDLLESIQVVDMNGRTLFIKDNLNASCHYSFNVANVCKQNNVYNVIAKFKYAKVNAFRFIKWKTGSTK